MYWTSTDAVTGRAGPGCRAARRPTAVNIYPRRDVRRATTSSVVSDPIELLATPSGVGLVVRRLGWFLLFLGTRWGDV